MLIKNVDFFFITYQDEIQKCLKKIKIENNPRRVGATD